MKNEMRTNNTPMDENSLSSINHETNIQQIIAGTATFVIDSDVALAAWVNNEAGNDYTTVLVKSGTWTTSGSINLTRAQTKRIYGEPGNTIEFTGYNTLGIYYETRTEANDNDYSIYGLTLNFKNDVRYLVQYCHNLTNCRVVVKEQIIRDTSVYYYCRNLVNCNVIGSRPENYDCYCYHYCENLVNCHATGGYEAFSYCKELYNCTSVNGYYTSFYSCENLQNCKGSDTTANCFQNCTNLIGCEASNSEEGFFTCNYLQHCSVSSISSDGFTYCNFLTACRAESSVDNGFWSCSNMLLCSSKARIPYQRCMVIEGGSAVGKTADGGFNV